MQNYLFTYDLPEDVDFGNSIAIDTETMGLSPRRDRLCLVQISSGNGECYLVHFPLPIFHQSTRLKALLSDPGVLKIFHYGRFDLAVLMKSFEITMTNIYCTKIASKLCRTYTDRHSLKCLCKDLLNIEVNKEEQTSDWGNSVLTPDQIQYAACDVLYLHNLKEKLDFLLEREKRTDLAKACFDFLPYLAQMDLFTDQALNLFNHH